jgi:hypothetical protein
MDNNRLTHGWSAVIEAVAAELTEAVYPVALRYGTVGSWLDLKLEIWKVLSEELRRTGRGAQGDGPSADPERTGPMLERLVTYFGLDENNQPTFRRFLSYKIIAGPGPTEDSGVASIVTLALSNPADRCDSCQHFHTAAKGGPVAAMASAIRYLDDYHAGEHLQKVESDVRG